MRNLAKPLNPWASRSWKDAFSTAPKPPEAPAAGQPQQANAPAGFDMDKFTQTMADVIPKMVDQTLINRAQQLSETNDKRNMEMEQVRKMVGEDAILSQRP